MRKVIAWTVTVGALAAALVASRAQTTPAAAEPPGTPTTPLTPPTTPTPAPEPAALPVPTLTNPAPALAPAEAAPAPTVPELAKPADTNAPPVLKPKPKPVAPPAFTGTLTEADKVAMTLTVAAKEKTRTFQVTSRTRFFKGGKPAIFSDGVEGEGAAVVSKALKGGKAEAVTVRWGTKTESHKAPAKHKKTAAR
jgi:hypothetical protein